MVWKQISGASIVIALAIILIIVNQDYNVTENTYYCADEPENLRECDFGISGGQGTWCYEDVNHTTWDVCSTGWKRALEYVKKVKMLSPYDVDTRNMNSYNVTKDSAGIKIYHNDWYINFQPWFVMTNGDVLEWSTLPANIIKSAWVTQIDEGTYKYGFHFSGINVNNQQISTKGSTLPVIHL